MLERLFKYPAVLARHRNAPIFEERELSHVPYTEVMG